MFVLTLVRTPREDIVSSSSRLGDNHWQRNTKNFTRAHPRPPGAAAEAEAASLDPVPVREEQRRHERPLVGQEHDPLRRDLHPHARGPSERLVDALRLVRRAPQFATVQAT